MSRKEKEPTEHMDENELEDEEEYCVEAIRSWRFNYRENRVEYEIKWENYSEEENTWEPRENLTCGDLVREFENSLNQKQRSSYYTIDKRKLSGFKRNAKMLKTYGADKDMDDIFILMTFDDCDSAEQISIEEFFESMPNECLEFFESRLIYRNRLASSDKN